MRYVRFVALAVLLVSCKKSPMGRVEQIRDELGGDAPRWNAELARCAGTRATCAADVAKSIGGTFDDKKPDQITAAAVAVVVARDRHGSDVASPDVWLAAMRKAKGPGADALRLATSLEMSRVVAKHARPLDTDADARAFLADVASVLPGACKTYELLGAGAAVDTMPPADSPDHSACVQHDLAQERPRRHLRRGPLPRRRGRPRVVEGSARSPPRRRSRDRRRRAARARPSPRDARRSDPEDRAEGRRRTHGQHVGRRDGNHARGSAQKVTGCGVSSPMWSSYILPAARFEYVSVVSAWSGHRTVTESACPHAPSPNESTVSFCMLMWP